MAKIKGSKFRDILTGTNAADAISGLAGNDDLYGAKGNDKLYGGLGNDKLFGGDGNDLLDGGKGKDRMTGGKGNDSYVLDHASDRVIEKAGQGIDDVKTSLAAYTLTANVENLTFTGAGNFTGTGNDLANVIIGGTATNTLYGGTGDDVLSGAHGVNALFGGDGTDTVSYAGAGPFTLTADFDYAFLHLKAGTQVGVNFNVQTAGSATYWAAEGDTFTSIENAIGSNYADLIDMYVVGTADGGGGNDSIRLFAGGTAFGGAGDDGIQLFASNSIAYGGEGNDSIEIVGGSAYGGDGNDDIIVGGGGIFADGGAGDDFIRAAQFNSIGRSFDGGAGNDALYGAFGNDLLRGGAGNDFLGDSLGTDTLDGGTGDDILDGGRDGDVLNGGDGNDTVSYETATSTVTASLQGGIGTVGDAADDTYVSIENLTGSNSGDVLTGDGNANILTGGGGGDTLTGGGGADRFVYFAASDFNPAGLSERITDFSSAQGDKIDISALPGTFTFVNFTIANPFVGGGTPSLSMQFGGGEWRIGFDANGDNVEDFRLFLVDPTHALNLTAADFIL